jgi:integrase/recombinase XerD
MNALRKHLGDYLALRRGLGFELVRCESRLRDFIGYLARKQADRITVPWVVDYVLRPAGRSANTQAGYLAAIRGFAKYLSGINPRTEIPPLGLVRRGHRPQPFIYSDREVVQLLDAARTHRSIRRYALKPDTLHCLIGLLAVTGMRAGEALSLKPEDIDWAQGVVTVGRAKYQKTRLIPLHVSTLGQLRSYAELRQRFFAERPWLRPVHRFFVSACGGPLTTNAVGHDFRRLTRRIGLRDPGAHRGPRIHDLRHRFAVSTLLRWYRSGRKVDPLLPVLSTYLGHVSITGTYWYLTCTPELMAAAGARLETRWEGGNHAQR